MDLNKIFSAFKSGEEKLKTDEIKKAEEFLDIYPTLKILTFEKLMAKHKVFMDEFINNEQIDLNQKDEILKAGKYLFFNRGWELLKDLNLDDGSIKEALIEDIKRDSSFSLSLKLALDKALNYFVESEEYEKCSQLSKLRDLINEIS